MVERGGEGLSGAREVGRGAGSSVEDSHVVKEARSGLVGFERQRRESRPEIIGQGSSRLFLLTLRQLLLRAEPVSVRRDRVRAERLAKMRQQFVEAVGGGQK